MAGNDYAAHQISSSGPRSAARTGHLSQVWSRSGGQRSRETIFKKRRRVPRNCLAIIWLDDCTSGRTVKTDMQARSISKSRTCPGLTRSFVVSRVGRLQSARYPLEGYPVLRCAKVTSAYWGRYAIAGTIAAVVATLLTTWLGINEPDNWVLGIAVAFPVCLAAALAADRLASVLIA